jgi:hypothetical protein
MFTIKHVTRTTDRQDSPHNISLFEGRFPRLAPKDPMPINGNPEMCVWFETEDATCSIDTGIVYVMNAAGKTVETFRLKGSESL